MMFSTKYLTDQKGLTSTSANYLANIAKELIASDEEMLNHLAFYSETISLLSGDNERTIKKGTGFSAEQISGALLRIGKMHAFCAWIREAIKAKDKLSSSIPDFGEWAKDKQTIACPEEPTYIGEDDVIAEMSIKELNEYLTLEAYASTFGKGIHKDGPISEARKSLYVRLSRADQVRELHNDIYIQRTVALVDQETLESFFISLQDKYREYERQLNAIKFRIKEEVVKRNAKLRDEYNHEMDKYYAERDMLRNQYKKFAEETRNFIAKLKIVIPDALQATFEYLNSLGKNNK